MDGRLRGRAAAILAAAALLVLVADAGAEEVTRETYREAVEPICRADSQANERIFAGVRSEVRHGELKPAAQRFEKAASALKRAIAQIRAVPQPPGDQARLAKWIKNVSIEASLFERVAAKLRAGQKLGAEHMVIRLSHQATVANSAVIPFEFHYCRLEPSRFT